jgi:hypothetical protein
MDISGASIAPMIQAFDIAGNLIDIGDYKKHIATIQTTATVIPEPIIIGASGMGHLPPSKHIRPSFMEKYFASAIGSNIELK